MTRQTRAQPRRAKGRPKPGRASGPRRWSSAVTQRSNALDLESSVFTQKTPRKVALSLKRSAERSRRRKGTPYQSAMSMLTFYINRAGDQLPKTQRAKLEKAKDELRALYDKPSARK